jgi:hypothetical protein
MKNFLPLSFAFVFALSACSPQAPVSVPDTDGGASAGKASMETYQNDEIGYAIEIPSDWTITEDDTLATDDYTAVGTSFAYPATRDRSALSDAKVHVATMPACPAQDGGTMEDVNGTAFMRTDFDGVGAGNRYRGQTYQIERDGACTVITLYTHSCNLGVDCGPDRQEPYSYEDTLFKLRWTLETLSFN